jgi:ATP-dependent RNA helicase DbpA
MTSFSSLALSKSMLENLEVLKYHKMTPIQEKSIPPILDRKDILAQAKTGSGKTAAFGIGLLHNLNVQRYRVQALVLCPTRELSEQVTGELRRIARFAHNIKLLNITGGMPLHKQEHSLSHEAHIVVGTPGRILKLLERKSLSLEEVNTLVLDEADRMLDMGFYEQISEIIRFAPRKRQTLCFSATFPEEIKRLSKKFLNDPLEIAVETQHDTATIEQHFYITPHQKKTVTTVALLAEHTPESTLIFCNTKDGCRQVGKELNQSGIHCLSLHGDLEQKDRTEVLVRFSNGSSRVLVATDVAARGLDISDLGAVINYDVPWNTETYIHRIGRTGRAGKDGMAFSLLAPEEKFRLKKINELMNREFSPESAHFANRKNAPKLIPKMVTLSINGGRKNKISAGDILGALTNDTGITGNDIGKIDRMDTLTFVAVTRDNAHRALDILQHSPIKGRKFTAKINN